MNNLIKYAFVFSCLLQTQMLVAQTSWIPANPEDWNDLTNWTAGVPAGNVTNVTVPGGVAQLTTLPDGDTSNLNIGSAGLGSAIEIDTVALTNAGADIGFGGTTGRATVSNNGSWMSTGGVYVGNGLGSDGTLTVNTGAALTADTGIVGVNGGVGEFNLSDPGSSVNALYFDIGVVPGSMGTVNIESGASLIVSGESYVGYGGIGELNISDAGSSANIPVIIIGNGSEGTVNIQSGAALTSSVETVVGFNGGHGELNISGPESSFSIPAPQFYVGFGTDAQGTLNLTEGGNITGTGLHRVGINDGSGIANVSGIGTSWTASHIDVSTHGEGTLNLTDGAAITVDTQFNIATSTIPGPALIGVVNVSGTGTSLTASNSFIGAGSGAGTNPIGILNISEGAIVSIANSVLMTLTSDTASATVNLNP